MTMASGLLGNSYQHRQFTKATADAILGKSRG